MYTITHCIVKALFCFVFVLYIYYLIVTGKSSNGRIAAFEAVRPGSNPGFPTTLLRGGETVSRRAHNPKIVGSIPTAATKHGCSSVKEHQHLAGGQRFKSFHSYK